jgi:PAS domain S-box-containing protein
MAQTSARNPQYLTVSEAAALLGVSPWTLRNWDKAGKLKPRRHPKNGYRIYRHEDLESVLVGTGADAERNHGVAPSFDWKSIGATEHFVQFYESDLFLADSVSGYLADGFASGLPGIVVATRAHRQAINRGLKERGVDVAAARARGDYIALDAAETHAKFLVDGMPERNRFRATLEALFMGFSGESRSARVFGEMVALLWAQGNQEGAIRLEELWNELRETHAFALFCAYPLSGFENVSDAQGFEGICTCHSRVIPAESYARLESPEERLRAITVLQQKARALEAEIEHRKRTEAALVHRERELTDFFENAIEGLHKVGPDGMILWANRAELDLLGYEFDEYVGHDIAEFHVDREVIEEILARLLRGESLKNFSCRLRCKNGAIKHVLLHSNAYFEEGQLVYTRCFTRDVTERCQAENALRESERRFARFMHHLPGLAWIKDGAGRYLYANDAALKTFGASRDELLGKTDAAIFPPETAACFVENDRQALASSAGVQVIETLEHADGAHHSLVSKFPIAGSDGETVMIGGMAIDITDRVRAEDALRDADRLKDEFLATLAHELRNPLAPISNSLHLLRLGGVRGELADQACSVMERQVQHMTRILDDLLDISRITRGKLQLRKERIEFSEILKSALETSRPAIERAEQRLDVSIPVASIPLNADHTRLAQVFGNLLNNSTKYTPRGGYIRLEAAVRDGEVVVSVRDNGLGIPADQLPRIFAMFHQVDRSIESSQSGMGIGLTLVRRLVELHGGTVEAFSEGPNRGSEFVVRLPLDVSTSAEHTSTDASPNCSETAKKRILVADDNRDSATTLSAMLRMMGNDVRTAYDGLEAITAAAEFQPQVVLMDVGMPNVNGYDAARRIRNQSGGEAALLIAVTGWGQDEAKRRSKAAGFDYHLVKPIDIAALLRIVGAEEAPPS